MRLLRLCKVRLVNLGHSIVYQYGKCILFCLFLTFSSYELLTAVSFYTVFLKQVTLSQPSVFVPVTMKIKCLFFMAQQFLRKAIDINCQSIIFKKLKIMAVIKTKKEHKILFKSLVGFNSSFNEGTSKRIKLVQPTFQETNKSPDVQCLPIFVVQVLQLWLILSFQ